MTNRKRNGENMNYIFAGLDEYTINQEIKELTAQVLPTVDDLSLVYYDNGDLNWQNAIDDASTFPFFGSEKVIVVENCWFLTAKESATASDEEIILEYLRSPNEQTILIMSVYGNLDNRKTIVKELRKLCAVHEIAALNQDEFHDQVRQDLSKSTIKMSQACLHELLERLPLDLRNWQNELAKLQLYPAAIDKEVIDSLISRNINDDVFKLSQAVLANNLDESLLLFNDLMVKNNDPIGLTALLASNFRLIYQVKVWRSKGYDEKQIAQEFGIHPYRVKLANQAARFITLDLLLEILNDFANLDFRLKNFSGDRKVEFELVLISILKRRHALH